MNNLRTKLISTVSLWSFLTGLCAVCVGQTPAASISSVVPAPPFKVQIKKSVVFLRAEFTKDGKPLEASSTAFFIAVPDARLGPDKAFIYLVTNRHAVEPGIEEGKPQPVGSYFIDVNLKTPRPDGGTMTRVPIIQPRWYTPDDPSIDLAITPLSLRQELVDYTPLPTDAIASRDFIKEQNISEGDSVFFSGLFVNFQGQKKLEPIVRQGLLAMMPEEPIKTTLQHMGEMFLADMHAFGGNSGSPVFIDLAGVRAGMLLVGSNYKLLGVVSGYESEANDFQLQSAATFSGRLQANSGITTIVPGYLLLDLLNKPEVLRLRNDAVAQANRR